MNLLVFNQRWFVDEWRLLGHNVCSCGLTPAFDICITPFEHIGNILKALPFKPDYLIFFDDSYPLAVAGLDSIDIPTIFYSVDTHHHLESHLYHGLLFDKVLIAQKDYLPFFTEKRIDAEWFPLWASRNYEPSTDKVYGACFVGTMNPKLNPDRVKFFETLENRGLIQCMQGDYWTVFPHSEIVVNQTVKLDLNFRVFEAMMSGAMLLTEHSDNGLLELFENGEHLVTYRKGDIDHVSSLIRHYLAYPEECRRIGANGRQEVLKRHTLQHRAEQMLKILPSISKRRELRRHLSALITFSRIGLQFAKRGREIQREPFKLALDSLEEAFVNNIDTAFEDENEAAYALFAAFGYDSLARSRRGGELLLRAADRWPHVRVLELARIKLLMDQGNVSDAQHLMSKVSQDSPDVTLLKIEQFIADQLKLVFGQS